MTEEQVDLCLSIFFNPLSVIIKALETSEVDLLLPDEKGVFPAMVIAWIVSHSQREKAYQIFADHYHESNAMYKKFNNDIEIDKIAKHFSTILEQSVDEVLSVLNATIQKRSPSAESNNQAYFLECSLTLMDSILDAVSLTPTQIESMQSFFKHMRSHLKVDASPELDELESRLDACALIPSMTLLNIKPPSIVFSKPMARVGHQTLRVAGLRDARMQFVITSDKKPDVPTNQSFHALSAPSVQSTSSSTSAPISPPFTHLKPTPYKGPLAPPPKTCFQARKLRTNYLNARRKEARRTHPPTTASRALMHRFPPVASCAAATYNRLISCSCVFLPLFLTSPLLADRIIVYMRLFWAPR